MAFLQDLPAGLHLIVDAGNRFLFLVDELNAQAARAAAEIVIVELVDIVRNRCAVRVRRILGAVRFQKFHHAGMLDRSESLEVSRSDNAGMRNGYSGNDLAFILIRAIMLGARTQQPDPGRGGNVLLVWRIPEILQALDSVLSGPRSFPLILEYVFAIRILDIGG
ncbi:hypothetical protein [Burkholderia ubonensis]|uniref:hypothetical protein n=1 Tax=Burkholderia ubonensis TaxID=101571 RepID=UPI0038B2F844